ncbi:MULTISPECIES: GNAT family N-acetyltransferase [unclassified Bradyrhizobium]|uniref:GNAT family N-acetyltransferase n=1 Tax=unclassified Bradyrhizobium TaxID=2631580 RepID=UPI000D6538E6|nr:MULTISPECIES: GNAT family N-acetyltransferase [unclassified Bradyrhizobium]MCA1380199.1 GNAT family N-acetyltransferase [Bradyrhizobium sp. BRP05]MCA1419644.1 GNAT family N-acetyltransferase [Bradyrhizobium sp. BRP23]MCA1467994.1 GNAT family N-acetyltransferase [Bradyrhizobium sp. IC3195]MCA1495943.1 GNAT family N-acetyltransferase [Bradyrhizobium sp. NBAIM14]PWE76752.1 GCN5 family acetyltransferase [Bradyrhizobium sp. SUTN9-2]
MIVPDGYSDVPNGKIAAIVTHLEMTAPPARRDDPPGAWTLRKVDAPALPWYRDLFRRVGEGWLWFSRARMTDAELAAIIHAPGIEVYALVLDGRDEGLLELDFREPGQCELTYFGVTSSLIGTGAARFLMNRALERAWSHDVRRVWVHTCTLDHPAAVAFYQRSGFRPFRRQIEIADDPRLDGTAPRDAAKHVPIIE